MKICLACTHGGHLTEMLGLMDAFEGHDYFFVTYASETSKDIENAYFTKFEKECLNSKTKFGFMLIKTLINAVKILIKEKPDVIVSTGGADIAVPFCYIGKVLGAKVIFIETLARITIPSGGGRLVYPIADLFLVQWESLLRKYGNKATYWGKII